MKHWTPYVGFRTGLSEEQWLALSESERKQAYTASGTRTKNAAARILKETENAVETELVLRSSLPIREMSLQELAALPTYGQH